jgi:excisionase family DNA binding protein
MLVTPRQIAEATGISESTIKRWCDRGVLSAARTPGGHRRLHLADVLRALRERGSPILHPEAFGLPTLGPIRPEHLPELRKQLLEALLAADRDQVAKLFFGLVFGGTSVAQLADQLIAPVFAELGQLWECGHLEVYREREACEIVEEALLGLKRLLPPPAESAPLAMGGSLAGDYYLLPSRLAELVLLQNRWNARNLGFNLPEDTCVEAIRAARPEIFWLSISHVAEERNLLPIFEKISSAAEASKTLLVIGGRALSDFLRYHLRYSAYCPDMQHLELFLRTMPVTERRRLLSAD